VLLLSLICVDWSGFTWSTISQVKSSEDEGKQGLGMGAAMAFASGVHGTRDPLYLSFVSARLPRGSCKLELAAVFILDRHLARLEKG
jgi:hypothetical protein